MNDLSILFDEVRQENRILMAKASAVMGEDVSRLLKQIVHPPEPLYGIPTLEIGNYKRVTPMLKARFEYAGSWEMALGSQSLLSICEMERLWHDKELISIVKARAEYWRHSPVALYAWDKISVVALGTDEETYLIWPDTEGQEPMVYSYLGQIGQPFQNLKELFEVYLGNLRNE
jgi:hypothetical protein